jgi:hypothetical protein
MYIKIIRSSHITCVNCEITARTVRVLFTQETYIMKIV